MNAEERRKLHREQMRKEGKYRKKSSRRKKGRKKGSILTTIILIVAIGVFCFSAFQLYKIFHSYKEGNDAYEKIRDIAVKAEELDGETIFSVDFDKLKEINPDTIGWIRFEEPSIINYPVVHSHDNQEYLTKLFGEGKNTYGTLFVDKDNAGDFSDKNTFIYGHRMKSGSMFGKLEKYADEAFYKEHPYFYIYTSDGKESQYQIFAAGVVKDTSESYNKQYEDEQEFTDYISYVKSKSNYDTGVEVPANAQIVSLSTCTVDSNEDRFLVHAVKIAER